MTNNDFRENNTRLTFSGKLMVMTATFSTNYVVVRTTNIGYYNIFFIICRNYKQQVKAKAL